MALVLRHVVLGGAEVSKRAGEWTAVWRHCALFDVGAAERRHSAALGCRAHDELSAIYLCASDEVFTLVAVRADQEQPL